MSHKPLAHFPQLSELFIVLFLFFFLFDDSIPTGFSIQRQTCHRRTKQCFVLFIELCAMLDTRDQESMASIDLSAETEYERPLDMRIACLP